MIEYNVFKKNLDVDLNHELNKIAINTEVIFRGDVDLLDKHKKKSDYRKRSLAAAVVGLNNTAAPLPFKTEYFNAWTDIDAQELFLNSKPTCYLILSKPGAGAYSLGEAIAKKMNCIHLCPKNIISDEVEQRSSTGGCLNFNLKVNNVCNFKTILDVLKMKVTSAAVNYRGYVISGFPLVNTSSNQSYTVNALYGEEAVAVMDTLLYDVIYDLKRKKKKGGSSVTSGVGEEEVPEEEEEEEVVEEMEEEEDSKVELPKFLLEKCSNLINYHKPYVITKKMALLEQLNFLFNLEVPPDIIIFITCPNKDLVTKKSTKYFNYKTDHHVIDPIVTTTLPELRLRPKYSSSDYTTPMDNHMYSNKYLCRLPMNFERNSTQQMCNFKEDVYPFIEGKLRDFDPKQIIRLDGRSTTHQMMHHIVERLALFPIKPVVLPEPLYMEEPPEDLEEFWTSLEEINAIRDGVLTFKRNPSLWFNRCPVELKNGKSTMGLPKFAVNFFKHVYILSSHKDFVSFCRNPRPYLKLKYLEPTCRMIVIGTKTSGKTMVSECLSWLFDARVINFDNFVNAEKQKKYDNYAKTILSEIIATIEDSRIAIWQGLEMERYANLDKWCKVTVNRLREYIALLNEFLTYPKLESEEQSDSLEEEEEENIEDEEEKFKDEEEKIKDEEEKRHLKAKVEEIVNKIQSYKEQMSFLSELDDPQECMQLLDKSIVMQYAPDEIKTPIPKPTTPLLGEKDVTAAISAYIDANDLNKEIEPTVDEIMTELLKILTDIDAEEQVQSNNEKFYGKYIIDGFPTQGEYWDILVEFKSLPDYVISLMETREIDEDLVKLYDYIGKCTKIHQERFILSSDPLVKTKSILKKTSDTKVRDVNMIVQNIIHESLQATVKETVPQDNQGLVKFFSEAIEKFREDLDNLKVKFEENYLCYIDVELQNKSDVQIIDEVLLKLRQGYFITHKENEDDVLEDDEEEDIPNDMTTFNNPVNYCDTNIYCPIAFYDYGVLWEGNPEYSLKYNDKLHLFCKEECLQTFQQDVTKYQYWNKPYKNIPPLRFCVIGPIGSGTTSVSKFLAKELGLIYIDFSEAMNHYLLPRHFKRVGRQYENKFTDTGLDDEAVVEFQMGEENEALIADILGNETELRRMVHNYFERGSPVIPKLMQNLIKKLWFEEPFVKKGFVLDGYPRLPVDVEDMMACFCIPDLVIELQSSSELAIEHLSNKMLRTWKSQLAEAKEKARTILDKERQIWMSFITKKIVVKLIIDQILEDLTDDEPVKEVSNPSIVIDSHPSGSSNVDFNLFTTYNNTIAEYPEPVDQSVWPKANEVREDIEGRIESIYETDDENIESLKETLEEQKIKLISIDATKSLNKVFRMVLSKVTNYRTRNESLFEQTFIVSPDIAELLLVEGFCFLSKFNRMCPVYIFENPGTTQNNYNISKRNGIIFTVIHRPYIYFLSGEDSVQKFRSNPLKYVSSFIINSFKEYPLKIGVIGSPKSGKSSLSAKLAKRYGLICISKGIAVRNILENMNWTELAAKINSSICNGKCIDSYQIIKAVQTLLIDHRTATYGYVLDGFPETALEAMELSKYGLYPNIIFDITSKVDNVVENCQKEVYDDRIKYLPPYSRSYIRNIYEKWKEKGYNVRNWINDDYQNLYPIDGNESRWQCLQNAVKIINEIVPKYNYYLTNVKSKIVPLDVMCISNEAFNQRMSEYKNLCPVCFNKNILKHNSFPIDKKGVVQFRNKFYWICSDHMELVLNYPQLYLKKVKVEIPELPAVVKSVHMDLVYENGICIVTYAENLPLQKIIQGSNNFAATFQGKIYMHCSQKCLENFLAKPHLYADITVFKAIKLLPEISLQKLPDIGYLEQTVGNVLIDACCAVTELRPKYLGLSFQLSALLFIGLYLKTNDPLLDKKMLSRYEKAAKVYEARCKLLTHVGLVLRSNDNPFAKYPKCCDLKLSDPKLAKKQSSISSTSRVPVPDERYDFLCEYHKPASKVPAFLNVVDIAGLVRGAAEGQGLGNAFLSHIKACDAIFNLCRAFDDEDVIHVDGDVNPVRDLETIGEELRLKDEEQLLANIEKLDRVVNRGGDKKIKPEHDSLMRIKAVLVDEKKHIRFGDWSAADIEIINKYLFLTSKPALYLVNLSEKDYIRKKNKWLPKLKEWIDKNDPGAPLIPFSGVLETKLLDMDPQEKQAFLKEHNVTSALEKIIVQGYKALHLEYFFTAGPDEVKAWTIQKGTKAPQAAGRIHTDFEKGFIMAEVMHYKDFKEEGSEAACKSAGKYRQQGRNYVVEDGDIIFFKFNAGAGLKDAKKK